MKLPDAQQIVSFRHELHQNPETSGSEKSTAARIEAWLQSFKPDALITKLGGFGIAAVYDAGAGPVVLFRAELDALSLTETDPKAHKSLFPGVSHLCGHDGHMATLLGLAQYYCGNRPAQGKVVLLFQPEEETGAGALKVLSDTRFHSLKPDYVLALHNLPGFPLHRVLIKSGCFAAASKGMRIHFTGRTSHAAEPEKGLSPVNALAEFINRSSKLVSDFNKNAGFGLLTIIHIKMGEPAFGTNPAEAEILLTLRAYDNENLSRLTAKTEQLACLITKKHKLAAKTSYTESFPATINDPQTVEIVENAAGKAGLSVYVLSQPFKWSEDFGHFTACFKGALIGFGSGESHPALHSAAYDFPDELIPTGVSLLTNIYEEVCNQQQQVLSPDNE